MYQPYPTGGQGPVAPQQGPAPRTVQNAVKLMYAGAALSAIVIIIELVTLGSLKSAIRSAYPNYSDSRIHSIQVGFISATVIIGVLEIGLWLWMAWANGRGRSWARIVATVLFGLNTILLLLQLTQPHATLGFVLGILLWLAGLGAIYFLWQRESSAYFQARSQRV
jgi:hypothetical protein